MYRLARIWSMLNIGTPGPLRPVNDVIVSLVRRDSHDYYGSSATVPLSQIRWSRVPCRMNVVGRLRYAVRILAPARCGMPLLDVIRSDRKSNTSTFGIVAIPTRRLGVVSTGFPLDGIFRRWTLAFRSLTFTISASRCGRLLTTPVWSHAASHQDALFSR